MTGPWHLGWLPLVSAGIALVEADAVLAGQLMISRPLLAGSLTGALCGEPAHGLAFGALVELFCLDREPVGSVVPVNGTVAAACSVLLASGPDAVPAPAAFPAGLAAGAVHRRLEILLRQRRGALAAAARERLERTGRPGWPSLLSLSIAAQLAVTAAVVYLAVSAGGPAASWAWEAAPRPLRAGLEGGFHWAVWIGLAALVSALWRPR